MGTQRIPDSWEAEEETRSSSRQSDESSGLTDQVSDTARKAKEKIADAGRSAKAKVDDSREPVASGLESAASTLHARADSLPGGENVTAAAHKAAEKMESTATYVRTHDVESMLDDVESAAPFQRTRLLADDLERRADFCLR